jgi:hypothetical protein
MEEFDSPVREDMRRFLLALSNAMLRRKGDSLKPPRLEATQLKPSDADFHPLPISMALAHLQTHPDESSYEMHVRGEAAVAAALVSLLQRCSPRDDIFVATPHRVQRQAVKEALASLKAGYERDVLIAALEDMTLQTKDRSSPSTGEVTVDTVERLQGRRNSLVFLVGLTIWLQVLKRRS